MSSLLFDAQGHLDGKLVQGWIQFILLIGGFWIAFNTYAKTQLQRRLENSFRLIDLAHKTGSTGDLRKFVDHLILYKGQLAFPPDPSSMKWNYDPMGPFKEGWEIVKLHDMFSGRWKVWDNDLILRFCRLFDFICGQVDNRAADPRPILLEFEEVISDLKKLISAAGADDPTIAPRFPHLVKFNFLPCTM
jgi:hypothetical protein